MSLHDDNHIPKPSSRTHEDVEAGRFLENIKNIQPSSEFPSSSESSIPVHTRKNENMDNGGTGGSDGNDRPPSGGDYASPRRRNFFIPIIAIIFLPLFGYIAFSLGSNNSKKVESVEVVKKQVVVPQMESPTPTQEAQIKIERERIAIEQAKIDLERQRREMEVKASEPATIVYGTMFSCGTIEEKDEGYAKADTQQVNAGESMHLSPGCAAIRINGTVTKLDADKYELVVPVDDYYGNSYKCGNANGHNDSIFSCTEFLSRHAGKTVLAILKDGGYVHVTLGK